MVFKNNLSPDVCYEHFKHEKGTRGILRSLSDFLSNKMTMKRLVFNDSKLKIIDAIEPSEMIWDNLSYNSFHQGLRTVVIISASV